MTGTEELEPPKPGEGLLIRQAPEHPIQMFALVWPSVQDGGFYDAVIFDGGSATTLSKPIVWSGIDASLSCLLLRINDPGQVKRFGVDAGQLEELRRSVSPAATPNTRRQR